MQTKLGSLFTSMANLQPIVISFLLSHVMSKPTLAVLVFMLLKRVNPRNVLVTSNICTWEHSNGGDSDAWTEPFLHQVIDEPRHDKTDKVIVRPAKTQISLGIRPVWSESSLCA